MSQRSVLQDWVMELPLREQGTLLTAVRGCDLTPKFPLDAIERRMVAAVRGAFMVSADPREVDSVPGCFMLSTPPTDFKPSSIGHYPLHWVNHLANAIEIIAYRHPVAATRAAWYAIYDLMTTSLHVRPESRDEMIDRLSEDRVASGQIVS